jgi:two-component system nitrogen regulation sensor histidine kinase NtrY
MTSSFLNNFHRLSESEYSNKFIKDSLINQNFSGYLNKYDTRIYTFDSLYHPMFNEDSPSLPDQNDHTEPGQANGHT